MKKMRELYIEYKNKYLELSKEEKIKYSWACLILCVVLLGIVFISALKESSVNRIQLSIKEQDYYKNEEIEVNVDVNSLYHLSEDQIDIWGGTVQQKDNNTFILQFSSTGTFHVFAHANGIQSNELVIKVVSENATANRIPDETEETEQTAQEVVDEHKAQIPTGDEDLSDPNNLYFAEPSQLVDANYLADYRRSYVGYTFAFEAYIPEGGENFVIASNGGHITVNNLDTVPRIGYTRFYGTMEPDGFNVEVYSIVE